jgi:hypothetical protein
MKNKTKCKSDICARPDSLVGVRLRTFERHLLSKHLESSGLNASDYLRQMLGFSTLGRKYQNYSKK